MASTSSKVAVVIGVGPQLGRSAAVRFASEGYNVGLISRKDSSLKPVHQEIVSSGGKAVSCAVDTTHEAALKAAFDKINAELGTPEVVVYNVGGFLRGGILEMKSDDFVNSWKVSCLGGLLTLQNALPGMLKLGKGTVIFTGATAALRGSAKFGGFAVGKFGLRALAQSAAREFGPQNVHVAHVNIDGQIWGKNMQQWYPNRDKSTFLDPDAIAETYYQLHLQPNTAWTHEMELRPAVEKW